MGNGKGKQGKGVGQGGEKVIEKDRGGREAVRKERKGSFLFVFPGIFTVSPLLLKLLGYCTYYIRLVWIILIPYVQKGQTLNALWKENGLRLYLQKSHFISIHLCRNAIFIS